MQKTASEIKSVLVYVGLDRLGDGLLKLPFVHGLKGAFPNAKITWFAGKETTVYARALAPLVEGYIDEIIEYGGVGLEPKELLRARPLKDRRFDLIIDTQKIVWTSLSAWSVHIARGTVPILIQKTVAWVQIPKSHATPDVGFIGNRQRPIIPNAREADDQHSWCTPRRSATIAAQGQRLRRFRTWIRWPTQMLAAGTIYPSRPKCDSAG